MNTHITRLVTLVGALLLLPYLLFAQTYFGPDAAQQIENAEAVYFVERQSRPHYVRFSPGAVTKSTGLPYWLTKTALKNASETLVPGEVSTDRLGVKHAEYQQQYHGHRVLGGTYRLHSANGFLVAASGELFDDFAPVPARIMKAATAFDHARRHLPATRYAWEVTVPATGLAYTEQPTPELMWAPAGLDFTQPMQLTYAVTVHGMNPTFREQLFLDPTNGDIVARQNLLPHTEANGTAITTLSGEQAITTYQTDAGNYILEDMGRNIGTYSLQNTEDANQAIDFTDDDNHWDNVNSNGDEIATDLHYGARLFHDLLDSMGRNSIDDNGHALTSYGHVGINLGNAYWDGTSAFFGDGNPFSILSAPLVSVGVVGHEFTHGLIEKTADLIYANESGALNESFADIFGHMSNRRGRGEATSTWTIGTEYTTDGLGHRSFSDPNSFQLPDTYGGDLWNDFSGVHTNSAIQNHWFYRLSVGGQGVNDLDEAFSVEAVGRDTAFAIAYRMLTVYLTPDSDFNDAAIFAKASAEDLYGNCSSVIASVGNAWHSVGVGEPVSTEFVVDFEANRRTFCETPAVVNFTNTSGNVDASFWDFGDGATSTEENPTHEYSAPGRYTVMLRTIDCEGLTDSLTRTDYIVIDEEAGICQETIMLPGRTVTLNRCSGLILDSGGRDGNYENLERSAVLIEVGDAQIELTFETFRTEGGFDFLAIHDGNSANAPLLGSFTGPVPTAEKVTSSGGQLFIEFTSDGSVTDIGFALSYSTIGGLQPANADLVVSDVTPLFNQPLTLSPGPDLNGRITGYDMGDGTVYDGSDFVQHRYTTPGTFTIQQYVNACVNRDTAFQQVVVAEPGVLFYTPDTIQATLMAGDSLDLPFVISNQGLADSLFYLITPPFAEPFVSSFTRSYNLNRASTTHTFPSFAMPPGSVELEVTINGDFAEPDKFAAVFINNRIAGSMNPILTNPGIDFSRRFTIDESDLELFRSGNGLTVRVTNSLNTRLWLPGEDFHQIDLIVNESTPASVSGQLSGAIGAGASEELTVKLNATDLVGGRYEYAMDLLSGDADRPEVTVPVILNVVGVPELTLGTAVIDFGETLVGIPGSREVTITNTGTDSLFIDELTLPDGSVFSVMPSTFSGLGIQESITLEFGYDPAGPSTDSLVVLLRSNAEEKLLLLRGNGKFNSDISVMPDTLYYDISNSNNFTQTQTATVTNLGMGLLEWSVPTEKVTSFQVIYLSNGRLRIRDENLLEQLRSVPNVGNVNVHVVDKLIEFERLLNDHIILVMGESTDLRNRTDYQQVITEFTAQGGGILLTGASIENLEIFTGSNPFLRSIFNGADGFAQNPDHALLKGLGPLYPIPADHYTFNLNQSQFHNEILQADFDTYLGTVEHGNGMVIALGESFSNPSDFDRTILKNSFNYFESISMNESSITSSTSADTLALQESDELEITVDGTNLSPGEYLFKFPVSSNDSLKPEVVVPLLVNVWIAPTAQISATLNRVCDGQVNFTDASINNPTSWAWDFGDGSTSNDQSPLHLYEVPGIYTVMLEVCNDLGCSTATTSINNSPDNNCQMVEMGDNRTQTATTCTGTLTDGSGNNNYPNNFTSTVVIAPQSAESITFEIFNFQTEECCDRLTFYTGSGDDRVSVTSLGGLISDGRTITIEGSTVSVEFVTDVSVTQSGFEIRWSCNDDVPQPEFEVLDDQSCSNEFNFENPGLPSINYHWDFGDGFTSTEQNPSHSFGSVGVHNVTLTAGGQSRLRTFTQQVFIEELPFDLSIDMPDTIDVGTLIDFTAITDATLDIYEWQLGGFSTNVPEPVFVFNEPGTFSINLLGTNTEGCRVSAQRDLFVQLGTGTEQVANGVAYQLYPNPVSEQLYLTASLPMGSDPIDLRILDVTGRELLQQSYTAGRDLRAIVPVQDLAGGLYMIVLSRGKERLLTERFVVRR